MIVGSGNFDDEAKIGFDHQITSLGLPTANSAGDLFLVHLIEEGGFPNAFEVGLQSGGEFARAGENPCSGGF